MASPALDNFCVIVVEMTENNHHVSHLSAWLEVLVSVPLNDVILHNVRWRSLVDQMALFRATNITKRDNLIKYGYQIVD